MQKSKIMKMKSLNAFLIAASVMLTTTVSRGQIVTNFFQAVTNLNPAAYWPLQETAQPPLADVETNLGSFGAIANAYYSSTNVIKGAPGVAAGYLAADFIGGSGSGSFLGVPNTSPTTSLPAGPFSVEAWIYPSNVNNNLTIMAQAGLTATPGLNGAASGAGWSLNQNFDPYTGIATPGWSFHVYNGVNVYGGADALVATNFATNTWYHLVGVFDGTNATLYVNGINATTTSVPMPVGTTYVPDTWDFLQIGAGRGLNENDYFGEIEEAAIYTNALTAAQISQDFNAISGSSSAYQSTILGNNPVMYWRMDSPANNIAQPVSAYPVAVSYGLIANLNGLYSSAATPGSAGPTYAGMTNGFNVSGLGCAFNGMGCDSTSVVTTYTNGVPFATQFVNAGVLITNLPGALNPITNSFSFMYWFKCNPMDDRRNAAFGHSDSNWRSSLLANQVTANSGKGGDLGAAFNVNDGNWHFMTFVFTNTFAKGPSGAGWTATNFIYIDGVLEASALCSNLTSVGSTTNIMIGGAPDKNAYGNDGYNGGANGSQMFLGSLAHVAFFTNALTAAQIQSLYSAAGSPPLIQSQPSPVSFTNNAGTTNVFGAVKASGASTLGYEWFYNNVPSYSGAIELSDGGAGAGSNATGSATAQLAITNLGSGDTGYYFVVITNSYGSVTSVLSHEIVVQAPVISAQNPTGPFSAYVGQNNLGISVTALGAGLTYQWYTNGVADTTAGTASTYPWTVQSGQTGETFQCIVANANGSATTAVATLTTILTVPAGAGTGAFQANLLGLNPVAYWPLQETAQPPPAQIETNYGSLGPVGNAYYSSTNAVPGANGVTGDGDASVNFAGGVAGSFLYVPMTSNSVSLPVGPFTVEAWVYPTNVSHPNIIVSQTGAPGSGGLNGGPNSAGWALAQDYVPSSESSAFQGWSFHVFNGQGAKGGAEATVPDLISLNTWYHIVGVFDGTNCYLYIDGTNATPQGYQIAINGSYVQDTWDQLAIGSAGGSALNNDRYYGNIDEVAIYTNALTTLQISNHYAQLSSSYSSTVLGDKPYMYWRMDAPAYTSPDISAYPLAVNYGSAANMNGLYFSGDIPGISGPTNSGLGLSSFGCSFNGIGTSDTNAIGIFCPNSYYTTTFLYNSNTINSGILCTNDDPSLCRTNIPFTLACWFKGNPADNRFQGLVGLHGDDGPRIAMSSGQLQFYAGTGGNLVSGTTENYNDGNWHFAACVYTNGGTIATGANLMYIDGVLVASTTLTSGENPSAATNRATVMLGGSPDYVDSGNGNGYEPRFFSGSLAHVAVFTNALTGAQILNLYTNATGGLNPLGAGAPPIITLQPFPYPSEIRQVAGGTGQYIFEGVTAQGYGTLSYQWYFNSTSSNYAGAIGLASDNVNLFNTQTGNMTISNLNSSQTGFYFCVVSNVYGATTSVIDNVQIFVPPAIIAQSPAGAFSLYPNQTATLSVTAIGATNNLAYQWYTNNGGGFAADTAGTAPSYSVTAGQPAASGETYECVVTNSFGSATSVVDTLTILPFPASLTNAAYSSNMLALKPTDYWPMHEIEPAAQGDIETNYGSLGALGNGYYADWDVNSFNPGNSTVVHGFGSALVDDTNPAVSFIGQTNSCLVVPHISPLTTIQAPFTLEAWVKPYYAQPKSFGIFIGQGGGAGLNGASSRGGFSFLWNGSPNTFSITMFNGNGGGSTEPKTDANYQPDQWYHMVATFDGTNVTIYINGQEAGLQNSPAASMSPDSWSPLVIGGGRWTSTGAQDTFEGAVDEVAIYTNVLSSGRILQHYNAGTSPSTYGGYFTNVLADSPLLYYRMDSPTYTPPPQTSWPVVTNYGSAAINGVYEPGVVPGSAAGPSPAGFTGTNAMPGNGMGGYVDAGSATALNANPGTTNTSFSYMAWFRGHPGQPAGFQSVMSANDGTWRCSINSSGKLQVHGQGGDIVTPLAYNDGNWHQVVLTCVETNIVTHGQNTNFLYVDGLMVGSLTNFSVNTPGSFAGPEVYIGNEVGFTNNPPAAGMERCFSADICEAAFFNGTALAPGQVQSLYNSAGQPPYINVQPVSSTIDGNLAFTNTIVAGGFAPLSYQWYENGVALANGGNLAGAVTNGVLTNSLIINPVLAGNEGSYYVVVTNNYGSVTSELVTLTVLTNPVIDAEFPVPYTNLYTVFSNANPAFTVSAIGAVPLTYEWFTNGVIDGAALTSSNLTLTNVQTSFTNYCVITNTFGAITSAVWSAQVIPDPTNSAGGLAAYPQSVLALNPIGYWRLDDVNEDGPDDGNGDFGFICHDYVSGNDGMYTNCFIGYPGYNPVADPSDTSAQFGEADDLGNDFGDSLVFGIQNINFAAPTGSNVAFTVEAWAQGFVQNYDAGIVSVGYSGAEQFNLDTGADPGHKFRFFFRDASGATHAVNSSISPNPAPIGEGPWYHLVAVVDEINSNSVTFYINGQSVGSTPLTSGLGVLSSSRLMAIGSRPGNSTTNYNFQFLGNINDVSVYNYALSPSQVLNQYLVSGVPPYLAQTPVTSTNASGNGMLSVPALAFGTGPVTAWWSDVSGGTNIVTLTTNGTMLNAALIVSNAPAGWNNDQLELTVSNSYGGTNVFVALTIFTNAPAFTVDLPPQVNVALNQSYTYSATVLGAAPITYQWYSNSAPIIGATNIAYSPASASAGVTVYSLVAANTYGTATNSSTFTVFASPTNGYSAYLLGLKPVGYWPLQETNPAATATIETNYGSLGALGNAFYAVTTANETNVLFNQSGALTGSGDNDNSVQFSGPSGTNYAFVPRVSPRLTLVPPFTMETWVNSGSTAFSDLISESGNGLNGVPGGGTWGGARLCYAGNNGGGPALQLYVANGSGTTRNDVSTPANSLPLNSGWHHCVATYDGTTTMLYIDGKLLTTSTALSGANTMAPDSSTPLTIGDGLWGGNSTGPSRSYYGGMDEVAIYTNILTPLQVTNHYLAATTSGSNYMQTVINDSPLLYYRMDCAGYTNAQPSFCPAAVNFGSAPVNGTYISGTRPGLVSGPSLVTLVTNVASPINGVTACIDAGYNSTFNPTNQFTALGWFKGNPGDSRRQVLMNHGSNWALIMIGTNGTVAWTNNAGSVTSTAIVNDGNWHFIAGVYDGINNYIYVDGALSKQAAASGVPASDTAHDLFLGGDARYTAVGVNQTYFAGAIAQAAFFTNALTAAQIQNMYYLATVPAGLRVALGPANVTEYAGQSFTFSAQAAGTQPFYYQWYNGASPIAGATNASYTTVAGLGSATYSCVVTNAFGGYSSTNAGPVTLTGISGPTTLYQATVVSNNPVAFWRLTESPDNGAGNNGTIAYDYAGGHNGVYTNVQLGLPGFSSVDSTDLAALFGPSNNVDAISNSYVGEIYNDGITPINFAQPIGSNGELSVEAWVNSTNGAQVNGAGIVAKGYGNGGEQFDLDLYGGDFRFFVRDASGGVHGPTSTFASTVGQWYHVVGVYDGANGAAHLYVNGVDVADTTGIASGIGLFTATTTNTLLPQAAYVSIGARASGEAQTYYDLQFQGEVDDVALYNYALTSAQVAADYHAGTVGGGVSFTNPPPIAVSVQNGTNIVLNWPAEYVGYYFLEYQTNSTKVGLSSNWLPVGGSIAATLDATGWTNAITTTNGCVFFRLMTNAP
jgi:hypothetical protein